MGTQAPTMKDIAELIDVSKSTVSRALADDRRVSARTRARIQALAARLNYQPNALARALAKRRTYTLGLVIPMAPRSMSDPAYMEFVGGVGDYAIGRGYSILLSSLHPRASQVPGHVAILETNRVDGLILTEPMTKDARIPYLRERGTPFVFLGDSGKDDDLMWVNADNVDGARQVTAHLIERGHRTIGCIAGPAGLVHARQRLEGYRLALARAGLACDRGLVVRADFTEAGGYAAMRKMLEKGVRPTAVFVSNDLMAIGALRVLHEKGLRVPADMAVAGFDGIRLGAFASPPLTTVGRPMYEMGQTAAETLIKTILGEPVACKKVLLPVNLIVREST